MSKFNFSTVVVVMSHFNWKKFYNMENHLKNHSNEEEYQRSAIGRYCTIKYFQMI